MKVCYTVEVTRISTASLLLAVAAGTALSPFFFGKPKMESLCSTRGYGVRKQYTLPRHARVTKLKKHILCLDFFHRGLKKMRCTIVLLATSICCAFWFVATVALAIGLGVPLASKPGDTVVPCHNSSKPVKHMCSDAIWYFEPADPAKHCLATTSDGIVRLHDNSSKCSSECELLFHSALAPVGRRLKSTSPPLQGATVRTDPCAQGHAVLQDYVDRRWFLCTVKMVTIVARYGGSINNARLEQGKCIATCNGCSPGGPVNVQWDVDTGLDNVACYQ